MEYDNNCFSETKTKCLDLLRDSSKVRINLLMLYEITNKNISLNNVTNLLLKKQT